MDISFDLDSSAFSNDDFRVYQFKVKRCPRARPHDWTQCPFAHPGEKAKRRDPRRFQYSGSACPEFRRNGTCRRGDACPFAHGVFECWLHPSRYRTQMCTDGTSCKRRICFFAHTEAEFRSQSGDVEGSAGVRLQQIQQGLTPEMQKAFNLHRHSSGEISPSNLHTISALIAGLSAPPEVSSVSLEERIKILAQQMATSSGSNAPALEMLEAMERQAAQHLQPQQQSAPDLNSFQQLTQQLSNPQMAKHPLSPDQLAHQHLLQETQKGDRFSSVSKQQLQQQQAFQAAFQSLGLLPSSDVHESGTQESLPVAAAPLYSDSLSGFDCGTGGRGLSGNRMTSPTPGPVPRGTAAVLGLPPNLLDLRPQQAELNKSGVPSQQQQHLLCQQTPALPEVPELLPPVPRKATDEQLVESLNDSPSSVASSLNLMQHAAVLAVQQQHQKQHLFSSLPVQQLQQMQQPQYQAVSSPPQYQRTPSPPQYQKAPSPPQYQQTATPTIQQQLAVMATMLGLNQSNDEGRAITDFLAGLAGKPDMLQNARMLLEGLQILQKSEGASGASQVPYQGFGQSGQSGIQPGEMLPPAGLGRQQDSSNADMGTLPVHQRTCSFDQILSQLPRSLSDITSLVREDGAHSGALEGPDDADLLD